jgi:hypothetical protein
MSMRLRSWDKGYEICFILSHYIVETEQHPHNVKFISVPINSCFYLDITAQTLNTKDTDMLM